MGNSLDHAKTCWKLSNKISVFYLRDYRFSLFFMKNGTQIQILLSPFRIRKCTLTFLFFPFFKSTFNRSLPFTYFTSKFKKEIRWKQTCVSRCQTPQAYQNETATNARKSSYLMCMNLNLRKKTFFSGISSRFLSFFLTHLECRPAGQELVEHCVRYSRCPC